MTTIQNSQNDDLLSNITIINILLLILPNVSNIKVQYQYLQLECQWTMSYPSQKYARTIMLDILQDFVNSHDIDIMCLNETRICDLQFDKNKLSGLLGPQFKEFHNFSKIKGYSGVSVYSKHGLKVLQQLEINEQLDCESRVIC